MKLTRRLAFFSVCLWSLWQVCSHLKHLSFDDIRDDRLTQNEVALIVHGLLVLILVLLVFSGVRARGHRSFVEATWTSLGLVAKKEIALAALLAFLPRSNASGNTRSLQSIELPVRSVVDPVVAVALLHRILQRRKDQLALRVIPGRLTDKCQMQISELQRASRTTPFISHEVVGGDLDETVDGLLEEKKYDEMISNSSEWDIIIRMYGYPSVENRDGQCAQFSKRRSLEVLSWLGMNQDRPRRSAVRTAIWDIEITDASFSTVLSDVRRGISDVVSHRSRQQVLPPTFTDAIELGVCVTTDFDVLSAALSAFRQDRSTSTALLKELNSIRDIPFAGANYMWADLDGTTTRMVVTAVHASRELAEWARDHGETDVCLAAVKAGLRVLPGCEELLEIQHSFISNTSMSQQRALG